MFIAYQYNFEWNDAYKEAFFAENSISAIDAWAWDNL